MLNTHFFNRSPVFVLYLFALFFTVTCSCLQGATGNIAGEVEDAFSSNPIPNATIVVLLNNIQVATTTTDSNGNYTVANLDTGNYTVRASATNFQTALIGVTVQAFVTTPGDFVLQPQPGNLTGHVIDASTISPLPGATINVLQNNVLIATTTTDGSGGYTITGLAAGSYSVNASHSGYSTVILGASILPNQTSTLNFFLPVAASTIAGQVTLANTITPVVGAVVNVFQGAILVNFGVTDSSGNYSIAGIQPGNYTVRASATNLQTAVEAATVLANLTTTVNFGLFPQTSSIAGLVSNITTGLPIAGVVIEVSQNNVPIASAVTNANGTYTVPALFPGNFVVAAHITNYQTSVQAAIVQFAQTTPVDFMLTADPGALIGQVTDASNGHPIPGAVIDVLTGNIIVATGLTDNNGDYSILSLAPPGNYTVRATATDYQTAVQGSVILSNQTTTANFALQPSPGQISGQVMDATTSAPIPGAVVQVLQGLQQIAFTLTDASGNYNVPNLAPGSYTTNASATNYGTVIQGVIVLANQTTINNFALPQSPGQISGQVIDATTSAPIPGATVQVLQGLQQIAFTLTDSSGNYNVSNLAPGSYTTNASATNYGTVIQGAIVHSNVTTIDNFALPQSPGQISGQVIDATTSAPIAGATVQVLQGVQLIASTLTDASGNYNILNLAPGSYTTNASATNYGTVIQGAIVQSNVTTIDNFALPQSPGHISGQVIDATTSAPIAGATVNVLQGIQLVASTLTDISGNYLVPNLAPGSYTTNASATNYGTVIQGAIVQSNVTTIDNFALPQSPGRIAGQVIDATTSAPIAGATVNILQGVQLIASTLTDISGNYLIANLAPGPYITNAGAPNYGTVVQGVIVQANQTTIDNFALPSQPGTIIGHVKNANTNAPIPGATIDVLVGSVLIASGLTDSNGNYTVLSLVQGTYSVRATAVGYQTAVQMAVVQPNHTTIVNFSLQSQPGAIAGQVTSQSSTPIPGATVNVVLGNVLIASTLTDTDGNYSIPSLSPLDYAVIAAAPSFQIIVQDAIVQPSQTTIINFNLATDPGTLVGHVNDIETGAPVVGGLVAVFDGPLFVGSALTDINGAYIIPSLPPGSYDVSASAFMYHTLFQPVNIFSDQTSVLDFLLLDPPAPPLDLSGQVLCVRFLTQTDMIHRLQWLPSPSPGVIQYLVFQDDVLIATIDVGQPLTLDLHNRSKRPVTYTVLALNVVGQQGQGATIILP